MAKTLRGNPEEPIGGTLRGKPSEQPAGGTLRGNPEQPAGGTLRGNANQPAGGTLRGNANQPAGGTLRGDANNQKGGTLRGDANQPAGGTLRGNADQGKGGKTARGPKANGPANSGATPAAANVKVLKKDLQQSGISEFELNGVKYKVDGLISASTGEAEIYKISKGGREYALKLYYAGIYPDRQVIDALLAAQGTGFIVDVIEYGKWQSPTGETRDYELQPYYSGGDLRPGLMAGNASAMKATALAMLMAVKTTHDHRILHRDIKPGNFLYTDDSHANLVLCDFGIASCFDTDKNGKMRPLKTRAQFRTKIYAAPETYTVIDGEIVYDDVKSDYYSLGMTLLTLWMGEAPFAGYDERALLRLKKGENGSLPIADDMPAELKHLIMGLTVPNPDKRWGFDEFERWLRGEDVAVEGVKGQAVGLNILYSGSKNQVANTFEQLVQYMLEDRKLAKQYLYGGKISQWLADGGYPELQMQIDEFINKTYPKNQDAGLMATAYLLDGDLPFESPSGAKLMTDAEIAKDMAANAPKYLDIISDPDSSLYVYYRASGLNYADDFVPIAKKVARLNALWRMIFTLNPDTGFPMYDVKDDVYILVNSVDKMLEIFAQQPEHCYDDCKSAYPDLLYDEAFILWLAHRDPAMAGKIKSKLAQEKQNEQLYYYIMYLLGPDRNLFLQKDKNNSFTIEQIAETLNDDLIKYYVVGRHECNQKKYQSNKDRLEELMFLKNNRLYYYLKAKELYKDKFDYIDYCFDIDSKDKKKQAGPYNIEIATFKAIKALTGGKAFYYFPKSNCKVYTIAELDKVPDIEKLDELNNGWLKWWLAVQYQEDPYADLSEQYAYEILLGDYTCKLGEIDSDNEEGTRTVEAMEMVEDGAARCKSIIRQVKIWRCIWGLVIALPLLLVAIAAIWPGIAAFGKSGSLWGYLIFAGSAALWLRAFQIVPGLNYIIQNCVSVKLGDYFEDHKWVCSIAYAGMFSLLLYMLEHFGHSFGFIILTLFCVGLGYLMYDSAIRSLPLMEDTYDDAINPDDEASVAEPLFYGWKDTDKNKAFESETLERQEAYIDGTKSERNKLILRTLMGLLPVAVTIAIYATVSPITSNWMKENYPKQWEKVYGGKGIAEVADDARNLYYADVKSSLTVRVSPSTKAAALGTLGKGDQMEVLEISNGFARIKYGDGEGYVSAKYIKPVAVEAEPGAQPAQENKQQTQTETKKQTQSEAKSKTQQDQQSQSKAQPKEENLENRPEPKYEVVDQLPSRSKSANISGRYMPKSNYRSISVYEQPLTNTKYEIGEINNGQTFQVIGSASNNMVKIIYGGKEAYVKEYLIEKAE